MSFEIVDLGVFQEERVFIFVWAQSFIDCFNVRFVKATVTFQNCWRWLSCHFVNLALCHLYVPKKNFLVAYRQQEITPQNNYDTRGKQYRPTNVTKDNYFLFSLWAVYKNTLYHQNADLKQLTCTLDRPQMHSHHFLNRRHYVGGQK